MLTIYNVNIIKQKLGDNFFRHTYKKYENDKLKKVKEFDEDGTVDEYKYYYNNYGKLKYRIYKNPNSWKNEGDNTWSYGVQDTILTVYKDIVNEYDQKNKLLHYKTYDLYESNVNLKSPQLALQMEYEYQNDNLVFTKIKHKEGLETFNYYKYNKANQISERYCCKEDIKDAMIIEKFKYKDEKISNLEFTEEGKKYNITFRYKFDSKNNWTEIIKTVDGIDLFKRVREIEYYK